MDVGDEGFQPVGEELDRPLQHDAERGSRHFVRIGMNLDAERPADIGADDAHVVLVKAKMLRQDVLRHVRCLAGHVDGELAIASVVVG